VWLAGRNESRAELTLTPPQMGKIEVSLSVSPGGETTAHFVSPSPQVREALEQSIARLREVFAAAGIALGQTSVSADTPARDQRDPGRGAPRRHGDELPAAAMGAGANTLTAVRRGLVDTFV
jgi:flagellar hook-length control protein FliK